MSTQSINHFTGEGKTLTARPVSEKLEIHMFKPYKILDHGCLTVLDYMGDEASIIEAARTSYGAGTRTISNDVGLLRYLMRHRHTSPIEMLEIKFLIKLPIFVARQHIRHRMSSTNEKSARYSILEKEFYIPAPEQMAVQSTTNKQGRGDTLPLNQAHRIMKMLKHDAETNYAHYEEILNETIDDSGNAHPIYEDRDGLARELARMNLTLNYYTTMVWKIDLHNLLHYLSLRADPHAQWEIRQYALKMCEVIQDWVPHVYEAFLDYRLFGATLSQQEIRVIRYIVNALESPATLDSLDYGNASKREIEAFKQLIGITK